jgi:hypothetical protein
MKLSLKDSRGRESITLSFVIGSWLTTTGMFVWKGDAGDMMTYGAAVTAVLAIWLGREWQEKRNGHAKPAAQS